MLNSLWPINTGYQAFGVPVFNSYESIMFDYQIEINLMIHYSSYNAHGTSKNTIYPLVESFIFPCIGEKYKCTVSRNVACNVA